jgi:hypothetical protein
LEWFQCHDFVDRLESFLRACGGMIHHLLM